MKKIIKFEDHQSTEEKGLSLQEQRKEAISKLPRYRGEVPSKTFIRNLPEVEPGQIFWVSGDNKAYLVAAKDGKKLTIKALDEAASLSTGITIYDMNKSIISKEPVFDFKNEEEVKTLKDRLHEFFDEDPFGTYYLLYGRDIHYLSLFKRRESGRQNIDSIFYALRNVGQLISMDFNNSDGEVSVEIWVRTLDSAAELLYLFPFDKGLIDL